MSLVRLRFYYNRFSTAVKRNAARNVTRKRCRMSLYNDEQWCILVVWLKLTRIMFLRE